MKKVNILILLIGGVLLSACTSWLDVTPEDTVEEEDLFKESTGFHNALNGVYQQMASTSLYGRELTYGLLDAMGQVYQLYGENYHYGAGIKSYHYYYQGTRFAYDANDDIKRAIESIWSKGYNTIANCNNIIRNIDALKTGDFRGGEAERQMIKGEALAARAWMHFDLLRLFAPAPSTNPGDRKFIPYVNTYPSYISNPKTVNECLELIAKDLIDAKQLLWKYDSAGSFSRSNNFELAGSGEKIFLIRRGFHLNYWAATALLARVYLYAQKEDEALEQAKEVMNFASQKGAFSLADRFYYGDRKCYSDVIFGLHVIDLLDYNKDIMSMENENNVKYLAVLEADKNYFGEDLEISKGDNGTIMTSNDYRFKYWIEDMNNEHYSYRLTKYDASTSGATAGVMEVSDHIVPFIRMSEVYYIAAEILCKRGAEGLTKAKSYLSYIKGRRGLKKTDMTLQKIENAQPDEFMDLLINDMRREWIGEGQTYFIYKRLNKNIPNANGGSVLASENVFVVPLPDVETNL